MTERSEREPLHFDADRGASRSTWIAAALVLALVGWMGSGFVLPSEDVPTVADTPREALAPIAVSVQLSTAESVTQYFQSEGQALPDRDTAIRAEMSGDIAEILVPKGADVEAGEAIARFDVAQGEAELRRAEQELARARRDFENAEQLLERGVSTADRVAETRVDLAAAQSAVTAATDALDSATIVAPFAGRIERLDLDQGEFVQAGTEIGRIVDNRPLTVSIQVPQQALTRVTDGLPATVTFITGEEREGVVTFVGTSANAETRTFLAEIEVANADGAIPAGISAEIRMPTGQTMAHFVSPSIVSLSERGELGVKLVNADNIVEFHPIQIVEAQIDGIWVTGLPDRAEIITIGQGFVNTGERVAPQRAAEEEVAAAAPPPAEEAAAEAAAEVAADAAAEAAAGAAPEIASEEAAQ